MTSVVVGQRQINGSGTLSDRAVSWRASGAAGWYECLAQAVNTLREMSETYCIGIGMDTRRTAALPAPSEPSPRHVKLGASKPDDPSELMARDRSPGHPGAAQKDGQDDYLTVELLCAALARIRLDRQQEGHGHWRSGDQGTLPRAWRDARGRLWWKAQALGLNWPTNDLDLFGWCRMADGRLARAARSRRRRPRGDAAGRG